MNDPGYGREKKAAMKRLIDNDYDRRGEKAMKRLISKKKTKAIEACLYTVSVTYQGLPDRDYDLKHLWKVAKKHHGLQGGSGFFFPMDRRDVSFLFETVKDCKAFIKDAKALPETKEIKARFKWWKNDEEKS